MSFKKIFILFLFFVMLLESIVKASIDDTEELININTISQEILEVSYSSDTPNINSKSAIVLDRTTKNILYGKHEREVRKMASTTKIMTAIIVIENANLYETVSVSKRAASTGGSTLGIKENDKITVTDLLYGLLLKSGNDTAVALAEHVGGSVENFASMMNSKAQELNLNNTHFVTPHGLDDDNHYTTAYELAILTDYALKNETFSNFVGTKNYTVTINGIPKAITNTNELLGNLNGVYGVKTGFTNGANRCLVTACKRDNFDIICIVLGADSKKFRTQDSMKLIEYTYKTYQLIDLNNLVYSKFNEWKSHNTSKITINKAVSYNDLNLYIKDFNYTYYPIKKQDINNISCDISFNYTLQAPLESNTPIGNLKIKINDNSVLNYEIVNKIPVEKKNSFLYLQEFLSNYFKYLTITF